MKYRIFLLSIVSVVCLKGETITPAAVSNAWETATTSMEDLLFDHTENGIRHLKDDAIPLFSVVASLPIDPTASNRCDAVYIKRELLSFYLESATNSILSRVDAVCRFRGDCSTYKTNTTHRGMSRVSAIALSETNSENLQSFVRQIDSTNHEMEFQIELEKTLHVLDCLLFEELADLPISDDERQILAAHVQELSEHARFQPDEITKFCQALGCQPPE